MRKDADVAKQAARFVEVVWTYDGLDGKVIRWTLGQGGRSDDPSAQAFVVGSDGKVRARLDDAKVYTPAAVAAWLEEQADAWERDHPATALAFVRATVTADGEGAERRVRCAEIDAAREARKPLLVYVARDSADDDRGRKAEAAASRRMEKTLLASATCAEAAAGWALVRLDLAVADHAALAASLGAEKAPALLVWEPGAEKPAKLAATTTAPDLAFKLRKHAPKER